jgi:hypothetical protein
MPIISQLQGFVNNHLIWEGEQKQEFPASEDFVHIELFECSL